MARVIPAPAGGAHPLRSAPPAAAAAAASVAPGANSGAADRASEFPKTLAAAKSSAPAPAPRAESPERPAAPPRDAAAKAGPSDDATAQRPAESTAAAATTAVEEAPSELADADGQGVAVATDPDADVPAGPALADVAIADDGSDSDLDVLRPVLRDLPPEPPADDLPAGIPTSTFPFDDEVMVQEEPALDTDADEADASGELALDDAGPGSAPFSVFAVPAEGAIETSQPLQQALDAEPASVSAAMHDALRARPLPDGAEGADDGPLRPQRPAAPAGPVIPTEPPSAGADVDADADATPAAFPETVAAAGSAISKPEPVAAGAAHPAGGTAADPSALAAADVRGPSPSPAGAAPAPAPATAEPPLPFEHRFAEDNHPSIVTAVRTSIAEGGAGGSVRIRLDPPVLGQLDVLVELRDGALTASFRTSNDDATRLLSHTLGQLRAALEGQGLSVDGLQVHQAASPREASGNSGPGGDDDRSSQQQQQQQGGFTEQERHARQEQQRRELMERVWRRLAGGRDPLDVKA